LSVKNFTLSLQEKLLDNALLKIQSDTVSWHSFRIRCLDSRSDRERFIVMPLSECFGTSPGTTKPGRAFLFEFFEQYMKGTRKVHIRGVCEDLANYSHTSKIDEDLKKGVIACEKLFTEPLLLDKDVPWSPPKPKVQTRYLRDKRALRLFCKRVTESIPRK
jgi:hypothetical protein